MTGSDPADAGLMDATPNDATPADTGLPAPDAAVPPAGQPIAVHPDNPLWLTDPAGDAIVLVGINHGWELQDNAWDFNHALDWDAWLDAVDALDLNFIRMWRVESAKQTADDPLLATPMPYRRSGPGAARDGAPRYALTEFNPAYFGRLRDRVASAGQRGIYVSVMFFERHSSYRAGEAFPWAGHPYAAGNNVDGIDADVDGDGQGREIFRLPGDGGSPAVLALQEALVRHTIDTLADLDTVLFEICNECQPDAAAWQAHMIEVAREHLGDRGHLVGFTGPGRADDGAFPDFEIQLASEADFVSPRDANAYRRDPPANDGRKVIFADSDHIDPYGRDAIWVWKSFLRGLHPQALDGWDILPADPPRISPARDAAVRGAMSWIREVNRLVDLARLRPRNALASTRYCLADPGRAWLALNPDGGAFTLDLSGTDDGLALTWLEVESNTLHAGAPVAGGGVRELIAPFAGPAVVFARPGAEAPEPPIVACDAGAQGFAWSQPAPFASTAAEPSYEVVIQTEAEQTYDRLSVEFDLVVGPWYAPDPTGTHPLFQLHRERWRGGLFGFMTAFGPGRNEVKVISNVDLAAGEVLRLAQRGARLVPGTRYRVAYTYDWTGRQRRLHVTAGDMVIVDLQDDQVSGPVTTGAHFDLILGGALNPEGPEVPTVGWRFEGTCVRLLRD